MLAVIAYTYVIIITANSFAQYTAAIIQFGETVYQADEGDPINLVIVMDRAADRDIGVLVRTFDESARCK